MSRNKAADLLDTYTKYLLREGYVDDDVWCEGNSTIDQFMQTKWFRDRYPLVQTESRFYQNCKRQRKAGAKICQDCPFRAGIESQEQGVVTTGDLKRIDEAREERSTIHNKDFFDSKLTSKFKRK